jgi:serine phosphatase RsbU (regulator of sigma subunit)
MHSLHPDRVLQRTNAALLRLLPEALVSAVYLVVNPASGLLSYANAGHPPPAIIAGTGPAEYLDDTDGIMLGGARRADDVCLLAAHREAR